MNLERVKRCLKLLVPEGHIWWDKTNGGDLETTIEGYAPEFKRVLDNAERLSKFFLPFVTTWVPELSFLLGLPDEDLTDEEQRGRIDGRMRVLFAKKGRLALYELIMQTAAFEGCVVRNLGAGETPYDFFSNVGLAYYGNENVHYGDEEAIYNNISVAGDAYLLTNGGSVNYFEDPETALVTLEQNALFWADYLVVEGPNNTKLEVPRRRLETFFDLVYNWKPGDSHIILNVEFTDS